MGRPAAARGATGAIAAIAAAVVVAAALASTPAAATRPYLFDGRVNKFDWTLIEPVSDEWNGFDGNKWRNLNERWLGRAPSVFKASNARMSGGKLLLYSKRDPRHEFPPNPPGMPAEPRLYGNWTTAFVESRSLVRYGYFQVHAKPGKGVISSSFWMSWNTPSDWTEIDVYELGGGAPGGPGPGFPYIMFMNLHVFRRSGTSFTPATKYSQPGNYVHSEPLTARFQVYAVDWSEESIIWLFRGRRVREVRNQYHQQPLAVKVDSETMPNWFGLPDPTWRYHIYFVSYIRAWTGTPKGATARSARSRTLVVPASGAAAVSPYALQRAPMPNSIEVAGLAEPVPRAGWAAFSGRGPIPRGIPYNGPVLV